MLGERLAGRFLSDHGLRVLATNVRVGRGEVDIVADDDGRRVVVEVRTVTGPDDPIDAVDSAKRHQVHRLAARLGVGRVDFVGIHVGHDAVSVHWVPDA